MDGHKKWGVTLRVCLCFALCWISLGVQAEPIATVEVVDGVVTVLRLSGKRTALAVGSKLEEGDVVSTEKDSYVRLHFTDGAEMGVRPLSTLNIQRYRFEKERPTQDALVVNLVKGGMRTVTGLIGKRGNENAYRVQGSTATIGIRGTEYVVRECKGDCNIERPPSGPMTVSGSGSQPRQKGAPAPLPVAARLAAFSGQVKVSDGVKTRLAVAGEALLGGETVHVSSPGHAVLEFNDKARVVLDQGSEYQLTSVRFHPNGVSSSHAVTDLVKGGLRMVTGSLGKQQPERVKVQTAVATIGIRGTNFDIWCVPGGSYQPGAAIHVPDAAHPCDQALYASTRDGLIELVSGDHRLQVPIGRIAYIDQPGGTPILLPSGSEVLQRAPAPEALAIDHASLFGLEARDVSEAGLYVSVKEGAVSLMQESGQELLLRRGEVGYAGTNGREVVLLNDEPDFVKNDLYLREMHVDPASCRAQ